MAQSESDILVIQVGTADPEVHKDVSEAECLRIIEKHDPAMAGKLRVANERVAAIRRDILTDPDRVVDYYQLHEALAKVDEKVNLELADLGESEKSTRVDEYHRYTPIGSSLLYSDTNFSGSSKFFSVTWPNMSWWPYRFNDRASSAKAWGGNILFQHSWYRGRRLFLIGIPFVQFRDLSVFGFNDIASSFVSLP